MSYNNGPMIITKNLVCYIDGSNVKSYPSPASGFYYGFNLIDPSKMNVSATAIQTVNRTIDGVVCFAIDSTPTLGGMYMLTSPTSLTYTFGNDYTIISWARIRNNTGTPRSLFRATRPDTNPEYLALTPVASNELVYNRSTGVGLGTYNYNLNVSTLNVLARWAMYTVVGSGGTSTTLYVNGSSTSGTVAMNCTGNIFEFWGNANSTNSGPFGNVCTLMIYDRALSKDEIDFIYLNLKSRFGL